MQVHNLQNCFIMEILLAVHFLSAQCKQVPKDRFYCIYINSSIVNQYKTEVICVTVQSKE